MHTLSSYIVVFLGAGLGGVLRHTVNVAALWLGSDFAHSTLAVNVSGRLVWVCWRVGSPTKLIRVRFGGCSSQRHSWWLYDILVILVGDPPRSMFFFQ